MHQVWWTKGAKEGLFGGRTSEAVIFIGKYICAPIVRSQPTWMPCFEKNNTTCCVKWPPTRTTSFPSSQTAAAAATNNSTFVLNICPRHRGKAGHRSTSARGRWRRKRVTQRSRRFAMTRPFLSFLSLARVVQPPALRDGWNTPAGSSARRHWWTCVFSCVSSFMQYLKVHLKKMTTIYLRVDSLCVTGTRL